MGVYTSQLVILQMERKRISQPLQWQINNSLNEELNLMFWHITSLCLETIGGENFPCTWTPTLLRLSNNELTEILFKFIEWLFCTFSTEKWIPKSFQELCTIGGQALWLGSDPTCVALSHLYTSGVQAFLFCAHPVILFTSGVQAFQFLCTPCDLVYFKCPSISVLFQILWSCLL